MNEIPHWIKPHKQKPAQDVFHYVVVGSSTLVYWAWAMTLTANLNLIIVGFFGVFYLVDKAAHYFLKVD